MHISQITTKSKTSFPKGRKNIDSRITEKINPNSRFTQSKKLCPFTRHEKSIGDSLPRVIVFHYTSIPAGKEKDIYLSFD